MSRVKNGQVLIAEKQIVRVLSIQGSVVTYQYLRDDGKPDRVGTVSSRTRLPTIEQGLREGWIRIDECDLVKQILNKYDEQQE